MAERQEEARSPGHRGGAGLEVSPPRARALVEAGGAVLVDVREPHEVATVRATGAVPIPLGQLFERMAELPRDREVLFICATGNRSLAAARWARQVGIRASSVAGGTSVWCLHGLPFERGR